MPKAIVEFIGTFFLVLVVGMTAGKTDFAPIAIGLTLMVMVYMGGHISGGHYNPAVTLGCLMRGATPMSDAVSYWIVQLLGGLAAALVAGLALAVFIPLKYVYPSRMHALWRITNVGAALWLLAITAAILWPRTSREFRLVEISLLYPAYYFGISSWLGDWFSSREVA